MREWLKKGIIPQIRGIPTIPRTRPLRVTRLIRGIPTIPRTTAAAEGINRLQGKSRKSDLEVPDDPEPLLHGFGSHQDLFFSAAEARSGHTGPKQQKSRSGGPIGTCPPSISYPRSSLRAAAEVRHAYQPRRADPIDLTQHPRRPEFAPVRPTRPDSRRRSPHPLR